MTTSLSPFECGFGTCVKFVKGHTGHCMDLRCDTVRFGGSLTEYERNNQEKGKRCSGQGLGLDGIHFLLAFSRVNSCLRSNGAAGGASIH
jgi:hypothetical protein